MRGMQKNMRYWVTVKPRSRKEEVIALDAAHFKISVKEPPVEGKANEAVERVLAAYFDVPASQVRVVAGFTSRKKSVEISR